MIRKIHVEEIIEMLASFDAPWRPMTPDEPPLSGCILSTVQLEREEILKASMNLFPRNEPAPTDHVVRVTFVESAGF